MIDFGKLYDFGGTVEKSDAAVRAMQAVQASARRKKHEAMLLRILAAALETAANDEVQRLQDAANDIAVLEVLADDITFQTVPEELVEE